MTEDISSSERKHLLVTVSIRILLALSWRVILVVLLWQLGFLSFENHQPFDGHDAINIIVDIGVCVLFFKVFIRSLIFYCGLLSGKVKKITEEFTLIRKEHHSTSFDNTDSLSHYFYLHLSGVTINQNFYVEVDEEDFKSMRDEQDYRHKQQGDKLCLQYYSLVNGLISARFGGYELRKAQLKTGMEINPIWLFRSRLKA